MPSNPQQNHRGVESNAPIAMEGEARPGLVCEESKASGSLGEIAMRAVSFFGCGWIETDATFADIAGLFAALGYGAFGRSDGGVEVPIGFGSGCKTGEALARVGNAGGRRTGLGIDSARETVLADDGGGVTGVASSFWGSAL